MVTAQQSGQDGVESLSAGGRCSEALAIEGEKAALDQRRKTIAKQGFALSAGSLFQPPARYPLNETQAHHQHLFDGGRRVDARRLFETDPRRLDGREPLLWQAILPGSTLRAAEGQPSVRSRADPDIILIAPV